MRAGAPMLALTMLVCGWTRRHLCSLAHAAARVTPKLAIGALKTYTGSKGQSNE